VSIPSLNPCSIPLVGDVCNIPGNVASDAGDAIMKGVTTWVTNFAVWVTSKVGELINATSSPDVQAAWFTSEYSTMLAIGGALALPMLLLAVIQAVLRQDMAILVRSAFGYLPMAFILAAGAIMATQLLIQVTDDLSSTVLHGMGTSDNLLARVGDAYKQAVDGNRRALVRCVPRCARARRRLARAVARVDHPRRDDLHRALLPPADLRRDDLARDEPVRATTCRVPRRGDLREARDRLDRCPRDGRPHTQRRDG
jgi:hypothetical protein